MEPNPDSVSSLENTVPENQPAPVISPVLPPQKKSRVVPLLLLLGLVILVALPLIWFTRPTPTIPAPTPSQVVSVSPTAIPFFLTVTNPSTSVVAVADEVLVAGKTLANTTVAVLTDVDDSLVESDSNGNFETTVLVSDSGGLIQVTAYGPNGEEASQTFTVNANPTLSLNHIKVFASLFLARNENRQAENSQEKLTSKLTPKPLPTKTLAQLKEVKRLEAFLKNDHLSNQTKKLGVLSLKALADSDSTQSGTKNNKPATKSAQVKLEKWAVKQATPGATPKRHAVSGTVITVNPDSVVIAHLIKSDRQFTVYFNSNTVVTSKGQVITTPAQLTVGMHLVAVGEPITGGLLAKRIHVIPGKAIGALTKNPPSSSSAQLSPNPSSPSAQLSPIPSNTITASPSATPSPTTL